MPLSPDAQGVLDLLASLNAPDGSNSGQDDRFGRLSVSAGNPLSGRPDGHATSNRCARRAHRLAFC